MVTSQTHSDVVNKPHWISRFEIAMSEEVKVEKYADHATVGRTTAWVAGWQSAWTQAYIMLCSVLESSEYDRTMVLRWASLSEALQWGEGTPVVRRWKNRENGNWLYAVSEIRPAGWDDSDSEFLRLNADS